MTTPTGYKLAAYLSNRGFIVLFLGILLQAGCSNNDEKPAPRLSEQQYYESAQRAMDASNYLMAIEQLEQLESRYPFGQYAQQAKLDLIFVYFKSLDYDSASANADRFIRLYPDHPSVDYAYYLKGLSVYSIDRGILARFLPTSPSERDITPAKKAFDEFSRLIAKFPNSLYARDAQKRLIYLRNLLAQHEINVANYYLERRAYLAAANRGRYVVENYQGTEIVAEGLATMVEAYRNLRLDDLADDAEANLAHNYPDYPELDSSGKLKIKRELRNDERSWINIITFGLLG